MLKFWIQYLAIIYYTFDNNSGVVQFRCLNILPKHELPRFYRRILPKARTLFNSGKKVRGTKGSIFRACCEINEKASATYFAGTHSDLESLSIYNRPCGRNNQNLEGIHTGTINLGESDVNNSAKGTTKRFINTVKMEDEIVLISVLTTFSPISFSF